LGLFKFFTSRYFWLSLLWMLLILVLLFLGVVYGLQVFTKQNQSIEVPDLTNMSVAEVNDVLTAQKLRYRIIDSTYVANKQAGVVITQYPSSKHKVKEDRRVFLTVNAKSAPKVKMPDLIDKSLRIATNQLENIGLKTGSVKRKPDIAKNAVLEQRLEGEKIEPGKLIDKGTAIDLVVGSGYGSSSYKLPNVKGLTLESAVSTLKSSSLKMGALVADRTVIDTATSIVYKQSPKYAPGIYLNTGQSVDLFVTHLDNYGKILDQELELEIEAQQQKRAQEQRRLDRISGANKPGNNLPNLDRIEETNPYDPDEWEGEGSTSPDNNSQANPYNNPNPYDNKPRSTIDPDQ